MTNPSTPWKLEKGSYEDIFENMVNQGILRDGKSAMMSFTDQIANITKNGDPGCYLFTAISAIPVADAVRGFYDGLDKPHPVLDIINADRSLAYLRASQKEAAVQKEAARLSPVIKDISRVSIVEQYVATGDTLRIASHIIRLVSPGIKTADFRNSNWYEQATHQDIDFNNITSVHADFMHSVGVAAAKKVLAGDYNDATSLRLNLTSAS